MKKISVVLLLVIAVIGCQPSIDTSQVSSSGATQTSSSKIKLNSQGLSVEQQNIIDRINVTTDNTRVMWIHLISLNGDIIKRMPVRNKVTSSGKRLEPKHASDADGVYPDTPFAIPWYTINHPSRPPVYWETDEFIQPDGTYGDSDQYIFWFDPQGRYHQWGTAGGLGYLLTDYPIDLENPMDKITGMYNVHQEAFEWQREQEAQLQQQTQ